MSFSPPHYTAIPDADFYTILNKYFSEPGSLEFTNALNNPFYGPIQYWDTKLVTNMSDAFKNNPSNYNISLWNTSSVTNMSGMFNGAENFNQPINTQTNITNPFISTPYTAWDVSGVQDMSYMFNNATKFNKSLSNWNVGNVSNMLNMFYRALNFNQDINNWNTSQVTSMQSMFNQAQAFNQPLNKWKVGKVNTMTYMFSQAIVFNQPLNNWDVSGVENMYGMFYSAADFNQPLLNWNVTKVTDMTYMFLYASSFDQYIRSWDVSASAILTDMLLGCPLATDTSPWNIQSNQDTNPPNSAPGNTPTVNGYFNKTFVIPFAPYYSYDYTNYPNEITITTKPGAAVGAGTYSINSVTYSEIPTTITINDTTGTLTLSTRNILGCKSSNQIYTISITEDAGTPFTENVIVNIKNTPKEPNAFPFPLEQKNKSLHGVNQKLDPGTARPNYFITRSQFNPARFRSKQSNLSNPSL